MLFFPGGDPGGEEGSEEVSGVGPAMSGDAPLRYGSPLSWPLVPPLADDDDDSVELPSTVDVKAIWVSCSRPHVDRPPALSVACCLEVRSQKMLVLCPAGQLGMSSP